jgi:hypothetical protein
MLPGSAATTAAAAARNWEGTTLQLLRCIAQRQEQDMNRNILYMLVGALVVAVGVLSYSLYNEKKEPSGLQINLGPGGLKVQNK